jgi:hypothetical protein
MSRFVQRSLVWLALTTGMAAAQADSLRTADSVISRTVVTTIPVDPSLQVRSATYTPSGKVLVAYTKGTTDHLRHIDLAVMDDDGRNFRPFFSQQIPPREKDNGIRFMVFPDNKRIFLGDFIIECASLLETCDRPELLPVAYPAEVADGDNISHRWSEIIVAPDNEHIAWTALLANYSAAVFTGRLERTDDGYRIRDSLIVSTLEAFSPDPQHADGVIPNPVRNGEVKQFVQGGGAISLVGALERDTADSVVYELASGDLQQITHDPGYDETTIFSPDEKLGIVMTTRFSPQTNLAILGVLPRPYPASLNMGLNMHSYIYSVTGVRQSRPGNIGPALIDIEASRTQRGYQGVNLSTSEEWVFRSPMSWHPSSKKAMWIEGRRGAGARHDAGLPPGSGGGGGTDARSHCPCADGLGGNRRICPPGQRYGREGLRQTVGPHRVPSLAHRHHRKALRELQRRRRRCLQRQ